MSIRGEFGRVCRDTRHRLDLSQQEVGGSVGISRGYLARVEAGRANPSLALVERLGDALGLRLELIATPPIFLSERRSHDLVHARCSGAVDRRLTSAGWIVVRELEASEGRIHGWIDLLAFHPRSAILLIIEIKTRLDDIGATERQIAWYERHAMAAARRQGWQLRQSAAWLVALWSDEVDQAIVTNREAFARFPDRASHMLEVVRGEPVAGRGIALIDPASHRADWLIRTRLDGRRSHPRFDGYASAARAFASSKAAESASDRVPVPVRRRSKKTAHSWGRSASVDAALLEQPLAVALRTRL
jgi:transcriptional regulator with XRE-family HTH domain